LSLCSVVLRLGPGDAQDAVLSQLLPSQHQLFPPSPVVFCSTDREPGHIPGSISVPLPSFLSPSGHFLPRERLRALFTRAGVDLWRPACVLCGSAVTACHVALAAHECGHPGVAVYDGGWSEWFTRAAPEHVISEGSGKHL
uniref:Sulfurtransferase n=1 Tax=Salarias fasciatus TaxID=181472 RepID=A0A672G257_SALFA